MAPAGTGTTAVCLAPRWGHVCVKGRQKSVPGSPHAWGSLELLPWERGSSVVGWGEVRGKYCTVEALAAFLILVFTSPVVPTPIPIIKMGAVSRRAGGEWSRSSPRRAHCLQITTE